ncbi:autotransporter outer membrane beta-barrel domain-containing protein [Sabulicella glaciei]|uniref:Autotransporter outer membrane beta-barrel domain-containing protein n=1 Tax=Sabulicella glaciei TaxID=2984948 RepID=A0ABT3NPF2_9PROT|nr:autotransporter outer membrane beta-barrel domain-containing protein [Roseococcus sp. MDT2-1-1]MCW8084033.1 autotransporter outer membrane beta-barrel domain-containing protein [Roseococcus sp. MDT2-1-1]
MVLALAPGHGGTFSIRGLAVITLALGPLILPGRAWAQAPCNGSPSPPPQPAVQADYANQSFGNTPPLTPYVISQTGATGCAGAPVGDNSDGNPGLPGQPGAAITSNNVGLTIIGGQPGASDDAPTNGALIGSAGGVGGTGGLSGNPVTVPVSGGDGGAGGAGGAVTVTFGAAFVPDPATGLPAGIALSVTSYGGAGGTGGTNPTLYAAERFGGRGGEGGAAGPVSVTASGSIAPNGVSGVQAISRGGQGGTGGIADASDCRICGITNGGPGGNGGAGGSASVQWTGGTIQRFGTGLSAGSSGGLGGDGGATKYGFGEYGGDAGAGGQAGAASVTLAAGGRVVVVQPAPDPSPAVSVSSVGGSGGAGGLPGVAPGSGGGRGGTGGAGGSALATILGGISVTGAGVIGQSDGQAVLVTSNGGAGGRGGWSEGVVGGPGGGGFAGPGGTAALILGDAANTATISTSGNFAHGAVVQSVGGGGGNGGQANFVFGGGSGGAGAAGGDAGPVTITAPNASVLLTGTNGTVLVAQSVGGGGGSGGDATDLPLLASYVIGGNGGLGGNGNQVTVTLGPGVFGSTNPTGGGGILAQSIGGSGGLAGSATATGLSIVSVTVGGDAGSGGRAGPVTVTNGGLVTTYGDHAIGIHGQSIGGGGGKAGSALTFVAGLLPTAAVSIGGRGGSGGLAGDVTVTNTAQVTTFGPDAYGVLIQSVGGGGGHGGAALARAVGLSANPDIPAISVSIATGGAGGTGNDAGTATLNNSGLITTAGHGAIGVMAQSVGGGGGTGGDSTASAYAGGGDGQTLTVSIGVAVGGRGGAGGAGGRVDLSNAGLIITLGQDAPGVFAQSIGGGGGNSGAGDATSSSSEANFSVAASIGVGGAAGAGSHGGLVGLTNTGSITTSGDGSDGVFAQSIGGGGGSAGGGTATASGGNMSLAVGVGGRGGAGGAGGQVTIHNNGGAIVTRGTDSVGIFAQSIGGGGGRGGKGGATAGGVSTLSNVQALFDTLAAGLKLNKQATQRADGILQIGQIGENILATAEELLSILPQPQAQNNGGEEGKSSKIELQVNVGAGVGGSGGAAGDGGVVTVTNTGQVLTFGAQSDGVLAQSVGGSGGSGGGASSVGAASDDTPVQASVAVGGGSGSGGSGGTVTVTNGTGGRISTQGVLAMGIVAQSIGGGGGEGTIAGTVNGSLRSLGVGLGGSGGAGGHGGAVSVTTGDGTAGSSITTTGKHGIGILAQSIGGGGGLVRTMTTDQTFDPSKIINNPHGRLADIHGFALDLGGQSGAGGNGGAVQVTVAGPVTTSGLGAHAVVAQSIGGGGGFVAGGQFFGPNHAGGDANRTGGGGNVTITLQPGAAIATAGDGAYGILAQSIGGGGGVAGDPSLVATYAREILPGLMRSGSGSGGAVGVTLDQASVQTAGAYAPAIFAQSVGGGGGMLSQGGSTTGRALYRGSTGGAGEGGSVTVSLVNSRVAATGAGSAGILAQSTGQATGAIQISLDANSTVTGGLPDANPAGQDRTLRDAAAIRILGGTGNTITNAGTITALNGNGVQGFAILADSSRVTVTNTGHVSGSVSIPGAGSSFDNQVGGLVSGAALVDLGGGLFRNAGSLQTGSGGSSAGAPTLLVGDLLQTSTGRLVVPADFEAGSAARLDVQGRARLGGAVELRAATLANAAATVLTASGGVALDPDLATPSPFLFRYNLRATATTLEVQPEARFAEAASGLGANRRAVAAHLQELWNGGVRLGAGYAALAAIADGNGYGRALDTLSGQAVGAVAAFRHAASRSFVGAVLNECPTFAAVGRTTDSASCAWARIVGGSATQNASGGALGYRSESWTFQAGGQRQVAPGLFVTGSLGYESSTLRGGGNSRVTGDTVLAGTGVRWQSGPWQVSGLLDFGYGSFRSRRSVVVGPFAATARAEPAVLHVGAHARIAYRVPLGGWYVQPRLDLHLTAVRGSAYSETGAAPFNLAVKPSTGIAFVAAPEIEVGARIPLGGGVALRPFASAGLGFGANGDWAVTARFAGQTAGRGFRATTPIPDVVGRFSVGAEILGTSRWDVRIQYNGEVGDGFSSHVGMARVAYRF